MPKSWLPIVSEEPLASTAATLLESFLQVLSHKHANWTKYVQQAWP